MNNQDLFALLVFILVISAMLIYLLSKVFQKIKTLSATQKISPHFTIADNPLIKRVLKRYPKGSSHFDIYIELDKISIADIRAALRLSPDDRDVKPRQLDDFAINYFSKIWPLIFDISLYDYFIHLYLKPECTSLVNESSDITHNLPREDGPSEKVPRPEGTRWISVRPSKDGYEHYMALYEDEI